LPTEIDYRQDHHLIEIQARATLPNAAKGEITLLRGETAKTGKQTALDVVEHFVGN
jgi:hypothetical protein